MSLRQQELLAPAKINLYLEILGRRTDGFHELETVFQSIDLADRVRITEVAIDPQQTQIRYTNVDANYGTADICYRAVEVLRALCPSMPGISVDIEKHIPVGGGLGGASSDAAAILKTLAAWYEIDGKIIQSIALELGSDVPFFLRGGTMHAMGRGEELHALPDFQGGDGYLLSLPQGQETASVFKALSDDERGPRIARGLAFWQQADLKGACFNRLTTATRRLHAGVDGLLTAAAAAKLPVFMSGSGSTCFSFDEGVQQLTGVTVTPFRCLSAS